MKKRLRREDFSPYVSYVGKTSEPIVEKYGPLEEAGQAAPTEGGGVDYDMEDIVVQMLQNSSIFAEILQEDVSTAVANDTNIQSMGLNMYAFFQRLGAVEEKLELLEKTTTRPIEKSTKIYLNSNAKLNNQINDDLNRLLEIQALKGVKYQELFQTNKPINKLVFSLDPAIDTEVKSILTRLNVLSKTFSLSFKDFFDKLD